VIDIVGNCNFTGHQATTASGEMSLDFCVRNDRAIVLPTLLSPAHGTKRRA